MTSVLARIAGIALVALILGCAPPTEALDHPARSLERISSTTGFSFLPPQDSSWTEDFGESQILYLKQTDPKTVSFYAGALEGRLGSTPTDKDALIAFVRSKKDKWGSDGRYSNVSSTFLIEEQHEACVRYSLSAEDHGAVNKGSHEFLLMQSVGRFCLHPEDRTAAVDIYYSVRHVPPFDSQGLVAEGEKFLESLQFSKLPLDLKGQSTRFP